MNLRSEISDLKLAAEALEPLLRAEDLAAYFQKPLSFGRRLLRGMSHLKLDARTRCTTPSLVAGWMSENLVNPPRPKNFDPLEDAVVQRCRLVIEELVRAGHLVVPIGKQGAKKEDAA